jgi:hypothetical protein
MERRPGHMRFDRTAVAAAVGAAALLAGGGTALAGGGDGDRSSRCEERLARIAERRGVTVAELEAQVKARLLARVDAAEKAGRITSEQAARLRQRIADASLCPRAPGVVRHGARGMLAAAADFLGLTRAELRAQLPGPSLAALAKKQGKSVDALKAAMLAPAKERLAKAVAAGVLTQARADQALEHLGRLVDRLVAKTFPSR